MILNALNSLQKQSPTRWVVGLSGGIDSTVLLHALTQCDWIDNQKILALHVNHQLQDQADDMQQQCAQLCASLDITFQAEVINSKPKVGDSIEAFARDARRDIFQKCLGADDILLTAQHQNDQAETVLLQLCRGAGIKGLSAMPFEQVMGAGRCLRPLLTISRDEIEQYAQEHQLSWVEDPSNQDTRFSRNFIRHEVMPLLQTHYQGVVKAITRSAEHCQQASELLGQVADKWLSDCVQDEGLSVKALVQFSQTEQLVILRHWLSQNGYRCSQAQLQQLQQQAHAQGGAKIDWRNREVAVQRINQTLVFKDC